MITNAPLTIAHRLSCNAHFIAKEAHSFWTKAGDLPMAERYRESFERVERRMAERNESFMAARYKAKLEAAKEWQRSDRQLAEAIQAINEAESFASQLGEAIAKAKRAICAEHYAYALQNLSDVRNGR